MEYGCYELIVICDTCGEVTQDRSKQTFEQALQAILDRKWRVRDGKNLCQKCVKTSD